MWLHGYHNIPLLFGEALPCRASGVCSNEDVLKADEFYVDYRDANERAESALASGDMDNWAAYKELAAIKLENSDRYTNSFFLNGLEGLEKSERCHADNKYCGIWERQDMRFADLQRRWTEYYDNLGNNIPEVVEYKFCPDENADFTWIECQRFDKGANYREVTQDRMERYDAYYFFTHFKRDRTSFNDYSYINAHLNRVYSRYFSPMSMVYRDALRSQLTLGKDKTGRELTLADFPLGKDWQVAGLEGLNFLSQIIHQPEPGEYCLEDETTHRLLEDGEVCSTIETTYCEDVVDGAYRVLAAGGGALAEMFGGIVAREVRFICPRRKVMHVPVRP